MNNREKFIETFGFEPDTQASVIKCPDGEAETACKYFDADLSKPFLTRNGCRCESWWFEEYSGEK